jgi:putative pyruvate formate lyase activating enzyme
MTAAASFTPSYLALLQTGELERRVADAVSALADCTVCPRNCHVDRLSDQRMFCATGRRARVASYFPHFGEEDCLRGWNGSGTIFFSWCNLRCVFCQNGDISQKPQGEEVDADGIAGMMLELQRRGCHNINFVTPEHVVPQVLEAVWIAARRGLRLPIVYNTSAYDSLESLRWMDGIADIYMPDFKYWDYAKSERYLKAHDYPDVARRTIREMHRQVGDLVKDAKGLARRGLLVRHLVMPNAVEDGIAILDWLAREVSSTSYVNVMAQYRPEHKAERYSEINRRTRTEEVAAVRRHAYSLGLSVDERRSLL